MLSLTHASAGALAGEFIPSPYLAFLVGIILHLIMDKIPHLWPKEEKKNIIIIAIDTLLPALFILGLYLFPETISASVVTGALGGVSVDFYFVLIMRSKGKWAQWHTNGQPHNPELYWVWTDLLFFFGLTSLLWLAVR